ncbi:mast cell-expressed membrane protein 1 isoform X1 [Erinaceus europaeus]|uniref:Mast cell-expressed membrane protein 1 isoform X1 n=1 Tax=Erinaceus europaeus TaxID=9365 RepID=A0ABM3WLZ7_ERIEU|nr:mast cell-expressed membrane protein 1 isoform X1 [Erinaceus europaeus]
MTQHFPVRMQPAAPKDKKRGAQAHKEGEKDPEYENINLAFRNREQQKGGHLTPKNQNPGPSRAPSNSAMVPHWLHRAILSLYVILALTFLFCIILSALILMQNSNMSKELNGLRMELSNVSNWVRECQTEQQQGWGNTQKQVQDARNDIRGVNGKVETTSMKLTELKSEINKVQSSLETVKQKLEERINKPA